MTRGLIEPGDDDRRYAGRAAVYTFYLCRGDGRAATLEAFMLGGDEFGPQRSLKMLAEHPRCAYVAVWSEDREVLSSVHEG